MVKEKEVTASIKLRKLHYLGHIEPGERYSVLRLICQGKILAMKNIGGRRMYWMRSLCD